MSSANRGGQSRTNTRYPESRNDAANKHFTMGPDAALFSYGASVTLDVSPDTGNCINAMTDSMTGDMALVLNGGEDGCGGLIMIAQNGAGGHKITSITATGRTVLMRDDLSTINTTAMLVASAKSILTYQYASLNGTACLFVSIISGTAAAYT